MAVTIAARFDGKVFVPEEPVRLPMNHRVAVLPDAAQPAQRGAPASDIAAIRRLASRRVTGANLSADALRRENM